MPQQNNIYSATEQPDPVQNDKPAVWEVIIKDVETYYDHLLDNRIFKSNEKIKSTRSALLKDMHDRDIWGRSKYKVPLQPFNGRDALIDLFQELLDAAAYTKQYQLENPKEKPYQELYEGILSNLYFIRSQILKRDGIKE
jgi:hypothetical protein